MRKTNIKTPVVFRVSLLLLCAFLLSSHMMGGLWAKYYTRNDGGDGARVARFSFDEDLSEQSQSLSVSFAPGEYEEYTFEIENTGEVALKCVLSIDNLTENLPIEDQVIATSEIACGDSDTIDWKIEWPVALNSAEYMGKMDILRVVVTVEQVD